MVWRNSSGIIGEYLCICLMHNGCGLFLVQPFSVDRQRQNERTQTSCQDTNEKRRLITSGSIAFARCSLTLGLLLVKCAKNDIE